MHHVHFNPLSRFPLQDPWSRTRPLHGSLSASWKSLPLRRRCASSTCLIFRAINVWVIIRSVDSRVVLSIANQSVEIPCDKWKLGFKIELYSKISRLTLSKRQIKNYYLYKILLLVCEAINLTTVIIVDTLIASFWYGRLEKRRDDKFSPSSEKPGAI